MKISIGKMIELSEHEDNDDEKIRKVMLLRTGEFEFMDATLEITSEMLRELKKNFDNDVKKNKLAVDFAHRSFDVAAGWIVDVILENSDTELFILVEWTEIGRKSVMDKEFRYLSADLNKNFRDNETGKSFGAVLNGAGLTNRPFVKGMDAILHDLDVDPEKRQAIERILDDKPEEKEKTMKFSEILAAAKDAQLSEAQAKELAEATGVKLATEEPTPTPSPKNDDDVELSEEGKELKEANDKITLMEKEKEFDVLLTEGKACPAQKEAYLKNDMAEYAKNQKDINLSAKGKGTGGGDPAKTDKDEPKTHEEAEDKVIELTQVRMKEDIKLSQSQANVIVLGENPKLAKLCQGR